MLDCQNILVGCDLVVAVATWKHLAAGRDANRVASFATAEADILLFRNETEIFGWSGPEANDGNAFGFGICANGSELACDFCDGNIDSADDVDVDTDFGHVMGDGPIDDSGIDIVEIVFGDSYGYTVQWPT